MTATVRSFLALSLCALLFVEGCAASLARERATDEAACAPAESGADASKEGTPKWVWITVAAVGAAAAIALLFAFVIVPAAADNAGRAAANSGNGNGGSVLPSP